MTLNQCFTTVLEDILGRTVREEIFQLLEKNGIKPSEISSRFDEVIEVFTSVFGTSAQRLVYKTVAVLYKEYSLRTGSSLGETLKDQVAQLRASMVSDFMKSTRYTSSD